MLPKIFRLSACFTLLTLIFMVLVSVANASRQPIIVIDNLNISQAISEYRWSNGTWVIDPWDMGIGHLEATAWFDAPGNIVLAGHSRMPDGSLGIFGGLEELEIGHEIALHDSSVDRLYQITNIQVVSVTDTSVVMPTEIERLTLITCKIDSYDVVSKIYTHRLVIVAERIS